MSAQIKYAYLKGHTWLFRRNWPKDVAMVLGQQALKQSLKTGDPATARRRAAEVNARYEATLESVREGAQATLPALDAHDDPSEVLEHLRASLAHSGGLPKSKCFLKLVQPTKVYVKVAGRTYLGRRSNELRPGGFKSVRYSVGLFLS